MSVLRLLIYSLVLVSALAALYLKAILHAVIALGAFSIFLCLAFVMHYAPDVAVAEAVVGAGITTGFYVLAVSHMTRKRT